MAAPTNVVSTLNNVGNREDLSDVITRVAPEETPFYSSIGKEKASARYAEWQTETLATPSTTNAFVEGDDVGTIDAGNLTTRVGTFMQISQKTGGVTRTAEIVDKAGRKSEMNRQKVLKGIELRRDVEARICGNLASNNESGATPRRTAGVLAWLTSNVSFGAGGSAGGFSSSTVSAATPGTARDLTEALVKSVRATAFNNGARPSVAFMGAALKQKWSAFTGIADIRKDVRGDQQATIIAAADVYVDDFGSISLVPHPYAFSANVLLADPSKAAVLTLDGFKTEALAKTGDNERFLMTVEFGLKVHNERAHAGIFSVQ